MVNKVREREVDALAMRGRGYHDGVRQVILGVVLFICLPIALWFFCLMFIMNRC